MSALGHLVAKQIPAIISVLVLLLAVFGRWPYGFYTLLRFTVCGSAVYYALEAYHHKRLYWVWAFVGLAILFNPVVTVHFPRSTWQVVDVIAAAVFAVALGVFARGRK